LYSAVVKDLESTFGSLADYGGDFNHFSLDTRLAAAIHLSQSFLKKFEGRRSKITKTTAIQKFLEVNEKAKSFRLVSSSWKDDLLLGQFKKELHNFFYRKVNEVNSIFDVPTSTLPIGFGPGASRLLKGNDLYTKIADSARYVTNRHVAAVLNSFHSSHDLWAASEFIRMQTCSYVKCPTSKLETVPKNETTDRVIMVEPDGNMSLQLAYGELITERLYEVHGIDISSQQEKNRRLAVKGSIDNDLATIDLSSASDSMSLKMLREVMPRVPLMHLLLCRTPFTMLGKDRVRLWMISTMGNGFTFPLQTAFFAAICRAAYKLHDLDPRVTPYSVFGDDIIVSRVVFRDVVRLLTLLGFEVNSSKTFSDGPFRESCGVDAFKGKNIRPVYLRRLEKPQDLVVIANRLNQWSARHLIPLPTTQRFLISALKAAKAFLIGPPSAPLDSCYHVPSRLLGQTILPDKKVGYVSHRDYQSAFMYYRYEPENYYRKFVVRDYLSKDGWYSTAYNNDGRANLPALELCFLQGALQLIKKGENYGLYGIGVKSRRRHYSIERRVVPNWDFLKSSEDLLDLEERKAWISFAPLWEGTQCT